MAMDATDIFVEELMYLYTTATNGEESHWVRNRALDAAVDLCRLYGKPMPQWLRDLRVRA